MRTLTCELALLVLEALAAVASIGVVAWMVRLSTPTPPSLRLIAASVLSALTLIFAIANLADAGSALNRARRSAVDAQTGLEHCFDEMGAGPRRPFIHWLKRKLPA